MDIIAKLAQEFKIAPWQAEAVVKLIDDGNTLPFIARYRKEQHGSLDDQMIREISDRLAQLRSLEERRNEISESLKKLEVWTEELQKDLDAAETVGRLEDIYRPFRPKRKTRASVAKEKGLSPLADFLLAQNSGKTDVEEYAASFISEEKGVKDTEEALQGAMDIIAETVSDDPAVRAKIKNQYSTFASITTAQAQEGESVYEMYYDHREPLRAMPSHRVLAMNRGEKEGFLKVNLEVNDASAVRLIEQLYVKEGDATTPYVKAACEDAYKRLIVPSVTNELRGNLTDRAQADAIRVFALNLRPLLMQPPVKGKTVIGLDPGYRHGCKIAVVDSTGSVLDTAVIYIMPEMHRVEQAKETVKRLIRKHGVTVAAIGNGTAGRETEQFFADIIREMGMDSELSYMIVSEAGASVYSSSKLAAEEFPDFDVNLRSAVSIARRLQDPLAELVKIDPKAIGVGQYQHDLKEKELDAALSGVVLDCVNAVGVDVNTASPSLLSHVAGVNNTIAKNIVAYREENGPFTTRAQLKKVPKIGPKAFEQCVGFLRIPDGKDPIENTGVHPESYAAAKALLKKFGLKTTDAAAGKLKEALEGVDVAALAAELEVGEPTLRDIIAELQKPGRDPRDELPPPLLRKDVMDIADLVQGMELTGTVRNVIDFGAFVDIGVHQDGLVHVSQMAKKKINHPSEMVRVGDVVTVWVKDVDVKRKRIALTMVKPGN
ncbi:MAG: Tex family protein [Clostridia bacterium]|nr:Tex family protein [Clostridia bacterium]